MKAKGYLKIKISGLRGYGFVARATSSPPRKAIFGAASGDLRDNRHGCC
jgi:hypothetical protein